MFFPLGGFKFRSYLASYRIAPDQPSLSSFNSAITNSHCASVFHLQLSFKLKCPAQLQNLLLNSSGLSQRHVAFCTPLESNWSQCKHHGWGITALQTQTEGFVPPSLSHWHEINYKAPTHIYSLGILPV